MYFYNDREKIKIPNYVLFNIIGFGSEVNAYKLDDKVLKIYKLLEVVKPDEECHKKLLSINTNQIILPEEIYHNKNGKYVANISEYKKSIYKSVFEYSFDEFVSNIELFEKDIKILSDNLVDIRDIKDSNFIYGDGIFLVDFSLFKIDNNFSSTSLYNHNVYKFKNYFRVLITEELEKNNILTKEIYRSFIRSLDGSVVFSDELKENYQELEKIFKKTCK